MRHASIDDWLTFNRTYLGPVRTLFENLDAAGRIAVNSEVADLARLYNRSGDETMAVPAEYVEVVAVRS